MKYIKTFKLFESTNDNNWLTLYFPKRELDDIEKTISTIESFPNTATPRKSNDPIINLLVHSKLFEFYKEYNLVKGIKESRVHIPDNIYDYKDVIVNINNLLLEKKDGISILNSMLKQTLEMIVYFSYFDYIRKDFNKRVNVDKEIFDLFITHKDDISYIENAISHNEGSIRNALFFMDSHMEIFTVERVFLNKLSYIKEFEKRIKTGYYQYYLKNIKDKDFEEQLYQFEIVFKRYKYTIKEMLRDDSIQVDDYRSMQILDKFQSLFEPKSKKGQEVFEFTGDILEDYKRYDTAYKNQMKK